MAIDNDSPDVEASSLVSQVISTWRSGSTPNAKDVLRRHPQLRNHHSLVLDLAYEEFCLRREAGERVVLSTFCDRFPTVSKSLRVLLAAHECVAEDGELRDEPSDIAWPETESLFLGFYLIREIGRGAFARVYLATEPSLGDRLVVVKISRRGGGEAETLGRLKHRNIVPVYSVQEDAATHLTAICMPYLGSGTLLRALGSAYDTEIGPQAKLFVETGRRDSIPNAIPEEYTQPDPLFARVSFADGIVHIVVQLADALAHAHGAGICHRDLKPSNVLLAPSGHPLLLDFNLSSDERLQRTLVGGTLPYMPPEQLRTVMVDDGKEPSLGEPRSDIFSLGVILYELLTGTLPFGDQNPGEPINVAAFRIMARQEEGFQPLRSIDQDIDPQLAAIVEKCLQLELDDRYQTAQQLASHLRGHQTHVARLIRWAHRRRFLLAATAAGFSLAAAGVGVGHVLRPPYVVRQYVAGVGALEDRRLREAVQHFTNAHQARPDLYEPLFARGQTLVKLKSYEEAAEDLGRAFEIVPSGLVASWAGYARQLEDEPTPALFFYERATRVHQYETAELLNNLGYLYRRKDGFDPNAYECLTQAIQLDPNCQFAYLNRALLLTNYFAQKAPNGLPCRQHAMQDVEIGVELEPTNAQARFVATFVHLANNHSPEREETILRHMRGALDHGYVRQKLLFESGFDRRYTEKLIDYEVTATPVPIELLLLQPPNTFPPLQLE